jgi:hypothetical protein
MQVNPWKVAVLLTAVVAAPALAQADDPSRGHLIQRLKDPVSGGEVRVYSTTSANVTLEIADDHVRLEKRFSTSGSETVVVAGKERVKFEVDRIGVVVTTSDGVHRLTNPTREAAEQIRDRLLRSQAMRRAFALLDKLAVSPSLPMAPLVWGVKLMVHGAMGDERVMREMPRLPSAATARVGLIPVSLGLTAAQDHGPGWCWDEYAKEAIAAFMELEDCLRSLRWYQVFGDHHCFFIYEMRALGAFAWWVKCVGIKM